MNPRASSLASTPDTKPASKMISPLGMAALFVVGCGLLFAGFVIRGLDIGTCPVMGYNQVVSTCIHTFPGTDIPTTPTGEMVMIIGGVLIASTALLLAHMRFMAVTASK